MEKTPAGRSISLSPSKGLYSSLPRLSRSRLVLCCPVPMRAPMPPDLEELLASCGFRDPQAARKRLEELFTDTAEMLALARLSGILRDALAESPDPDAALFHLARFVEARGARLALYRSFQDHPALLDRFVHVVASSRYLADILVRNPDHLAFLSDPETLVRFRAVPELLAEFERVGALYGSVEEKLDAARRIHRREIFRIGAADLLGLADFPAIVRGISDLADAFVARCLALAAAPEDAAGLAVVALGKWGGRELNYSSDIDLLFLARRAADVPAAARAARALVRALGERTVEGVVYRVDLRLRPYGSEGELAPAAARAEEYLAAKARPAERQAMLKARAVAGDTAAGRRFLRRIAPVLLRDGPAARQEVRRLKLRIERKLDERGHSEGHVKLAPGGIRDVEFIVQALQLEAGRERPDVLGGHTLEALERLEAAGRITPVDAQALREAYVFLRTVEHRLQLMENRQVHRLPKREEDLARLARTLGFRGPGAAQRLLDAYEARARRVRALFDRLLGGRLPGAAASAPVEDLRARLRPAGERLDDATLARAADALAAVKRPEDLEVRAWKGAGRRWTAAVAAADPPGLLALVSGLLAARRANIESGDFARLEPPSGTPRPREVTRKTLALFEVALPDDAPPDFWDAFRRDLAERVAQALAGDAQGALDRVIDRVGETARAQAGPERPSGGLRIELRNDPAARETELQLRAPDTLGFLFEFATALSALRLRVERAVIRTLEDEVYDTFWVVDLQGRRIEDPRAPDALGVAAALVQQFMQLLPRSPDPAQALRQFTALLHQVFARPDWVREVRDLESPSVLSTIAALLGVSRFLWEDFLLVQHENLFPVVRNVPALERRTSRARLKRDLARALAEARDPDEALERLNDFKDREMFRLDVRHITGRCGFPEFMESLSDLADLVVERALAEAARKLRARMRPPRGAAGSVAALGKFGGRELGLTSDLDLVFVYDDSAPGADAWFQELVRTLVASIRARREGSFAIDLRLRPYGDAGSRATSLSGFRAYYAPDGPARPFERLALVKLRPVTGPPALTRALVEARDAFVYSGRPLDYANLLHLRLRQAAELVPAGVADAKYSPGGLVDVEYFVQARQIEAGAADPSVRVPGTLDAIVRLARGGHLRAEEARGLSETYLFLRRLIDALRAARGHAGDSRIPPATEREFRTLVRALGYASPASLEAEIRQRMSFARHLWNPVRS